MCAEDRKKEETYEKSMEETSAVGNAGSCYGVHRSGGDTVLGGGESRNPL